MSPLAAASADACRAEDRAERAAQWTPGPWVASQTDAGDGTPSYSFIASKNGTEFYGTGTTVASEIDNPDDARLIAAAPDLYEACKAQHDAIDTLLAMLIERDSTFTPTKSGVWPKLLKGHAAIAKAEGRK